MSASTSATRSEVSTTFALGVCVIEMASDGSPFRRENDDAAASPSTTSTTSPSRTVVPASVVSGRSANSSTEVSGVPTCTDRVCSPSVRVPAGRRTPLSSRTDRTESGVRPAPIRAGRFTSRRISRSAAPATETPRTPSMRSRRGTRVVSTASARASSSTPPAAASWTTGSWSMDPVMICGVTSSGS